MVLWAILGKGMISSGIWVSLQKDAALDLREICLRLGSLNPFSVQSNTLWGQDGFFSEQLIASGQVSQCSQSWTRLSAPVPGPGRSTAMQSTVPAQALVPEPCSLPEGNGCPAPAEKPCLLGSVALHWHVGVWFSIGMSA